MDVQSATQPTGPAPTPWICASCGWQNAADMTRCGNCRAFRANGTPAPAPKALGVKGIWEDDASSTSIEQRVRSNRPLTAGVCIIGSGVLAVLNALYGFAVTKLPSGYEQFTGLVDTCLGLILFLGIIAISGGLMATRRRSFAFSLVGGIAGLLCVGFYVGAILALVGIIFVALSKDEFE